MNREGQDGITYLDATWNPVVGCMHGCKWCWARRQAKRQKHNCQKCYDFTPHLHPERLDEPLRRRKPSVIGVAFMGDLFDETLVLNPIFRWTGEFAPEAVLKIMDEADWHTFVLLTKQPQLAKRFAFPPNVVLGVSITDQPSADRLVPELLKCPAAKRIVSIEPMRGPVDLRFGYDMGPDEDSGVGFFPCDVGGKRHEHPITDYCGRQIDGAILGGQTGPGAVAMDPAWVRKARDDCAVAGVPFYFKSWGAWVPAGQAHWQGKGRMLDGRMHDELAWERKMP